MLMQEIYSKALMVKVWLGQATEDIPAAIGFLDELGKTLPQVGYLDFEALRKHPLTTPGSEGWLALGKLMEREWFKRIWVIQGVALASRVQVLCGNHTLPWELFADIVSGILRFGLVGCATLSSTPLGTNMSFTGWEGFNYIQNTRDKIHNHNAVRIADSIRSLSQHRNSSDPRDRIYVLLGISSDGNDLIPDYNRPAPDIYIDVARYLLLKKESLELLRQAGLGFERNLKGLPSWVPDYSTSPGCGRLGAYTASRATQSNTQFVLNIKELHVQGIVVDAISRVGLVHGDPKTGFIFSGSMEFFDWFLEVRQSFHIQETDEEAFWRTIIVNRCDAEGLEIPDAAYASNFKSFVSIFTSVHESPLPPHQQHYSASEKLKANTFRSALCYGTFGRRFCTLRDGSIGMVPAGTREGDLVCVLYGVGVSLVIRAMKEREDRRQEYELVGECYIHGIMDGEAIAMDYKVEDICLV
jgi:hypothetical protein